MAPLPPLMQTPYLEAPRMREMEDGFERYTRTLCITYTVLCHSQ